MGSRLYVIAGKVTDSVTHGFLAAAARLGQGVTVLTDRVSDHQTAYRRRPAADGPAAPAPVGILAGGSDSAPVEVLECDVTDFRTIVSRIARHHDPEAIFSNSDHLQTPTALAAAYFGLPAKDWRATLRTKNKALMRRHLQALGLDVVFAVQLAAGEDPAALARRTPPYPLVVKPCEGVASEDVVLVANPGELLARCRQIQDRRPADALIVEEYLPGALHTLETLGDGRTTTVLGSFRTTLSEPPYFIEKRLDWTPPPPETQQVLNQLTALGVGFGACHTEFVVRDGIARLIEVNYRIIGDHCDFLLADLLGTPVFEQVLQVHLGGPAPDPVTSEHHAIIDAVIADRSGTLIAAPEPADETGAARLTYRPLRAVGDTMTQTHTNRDYLGLIRAIGPDREILEAAVRRFRTAHRWEIGP